MQATSQWGRYVDLGKDGSLRPVADILLERGIPFLLGTCTTESVRSIGPGPYIAQRISS